MSGKRFVTYLGLMSLFVAMCVVPLTRAFAEDRTEIRVGALNSMTGQNAMTGQEQKWAYEQAVADINQKGGVYVKELGKKLPIKLIFADDKSTPDEGAAAMERLIKFDKIDLALSSNTTPINLAAATVCEKYKMYYGIVVSWLNVIGAQHYKWVSDLFTSDVEAARTPFLIWQSLPANERPKRPALMMEDNRDGQGFGAGFKKFAKEYGYTFVVDDPYIPGSKDFSSHILKFKAAKVDALLWLGSPTDGITLLRQMKEQHLKIPYIHGWKGFWDQSFIKALGPDANYVIHDGFWNENNGAPGSKELGQRFKKAFGRDSVSVGLSYANPQILAMAIERAGSFKSEKVRDTVFGGEFKGTTMGDVKFDKDGLAFTPLNAMQWWNSERMPIYPPNLKVWTFKPMPTN